MRATVLEWKALPVTHCLSPFPPPIVAEQGKLRKGINEKDENKQGEPWLGDSNCEGRGYATRWLCSGKARASRHLFSFSFCEPPAPGKTHLNMANPSHYTQLLAPACWRLVEVSVKGCPRSREGRSPHACSMPEPRLTHRARMSAYNSQQPQTAAISCLCQTNRISSVARGSPAGAAPHRMRSDILWATRLWEPLRSQAGRRPCGCCLSAPTPAGAVQLGDGPDGWSGGGRGTGWQGFVVAFSNVNRSLHRKPLPLMKEWDLGGQRLPEHVCRAKAEVLLYSLFSAH